MHRFALAIASLIAATALIGGCEQEPTGQPEPERTYFTLAALCGSGDATPKRIQEFLDLPVDVNAKNEVGWTPLSLAAGFSGNPEVITTLIKAGANMNAKGEHGWTPLDLAAAWNRNPEVITTLIKAGADVNAKTMRRRTPLDHAESGRKPKNAELIRAAGGKRGQDLP